MVQIVRLIVLYHDLKLEVGGLLIPADKNLDEVSKHYREMYFLRRAFATLWEMESALFKLNKLDEFKARKRSRVPRWLAWASAVKFFEKNKQFIDRQRNAYGGHVNDELARFILGQVEQTDDSTGKLEVVISDDGSHHYVFGFAQQIVSNALLIDRGETLHEEYFQESLRILLDAVKHAALATQHLADEYIPPTFGFTR
jgi:hypothetical protein